MFGNLVFEIKKVVEQNKLFRNISRTKQRPIQGIYDIMIKKYIEIILLNGIHSNIDFKRIIKSFCIQNRIQN